MFFFLIIEHHKRASLRTLWVLIGRYWKKIAKIGFGTSEALRYVPRLRLVRLFLPTPQDQKDWGQENNIFKMLFLFFYFCSSGFGFYFSSIAYSYARRWSC
jgi:hypothetical protein